LRLDKSTITIPLNSDPKAASNNYEAAFFMEKLREFLKRPGKFDFPLAVELLKEFDSKNSLLSYFSAAISNSFNDAKLRAELLKVLSNTPKVLIASVTVEESAVAAPIREISNALSSRVKPSIAFESLPEHLQKDYLRRNDLVRQADILKERIRNTPEKKERYNLGLKLLRSWNEIRCIWNKLDAHTSGEDTERDNSIELANYSTEQLKALKQRHMVSRSKAKSKGNTDKFNYYEELIRHINERLHVQIQ
jgi:hypothetical protein